MRLIDADALQAQLEKKKYKGPEQAWYSSGWDDCLMRVKSMLHSAPTVAEAGDTVRARVEIIEGEEE